MRHSFFGIAILLAVFLTVPTSAAENIVTPDNPDYPEKVAAETAKLIEAGTPGKQISVLAEITEERIAEMRVVIEQKKLAYLPALIEAYVKLTAQSKTLLQAARRSDDFTEQAARSFLTTVFKQKTELGGLALAVPKEEKRLFDKAVRAAETAQKAAIGAWKSEPSNEGEATKGPVNVRIDVKTTESGKIHNVVGGVNWKYTSGKVTVESKGNVLNKNGLRVGYASGGWTVDAEIESRRTRYSNLSNEFVVTLSGRPAIIDIGKIYAEPMTLGVFVWGGKAFEMNSYRLIKAGASLEVLPTVLGNGNIRVTVIPRLTTYDPKRKVLSLKELATTVVVRSGHSIVIGGLDTQENTVGRTFFRRRKGSGVVNQCVVLTPTIVKFPVIPKR